ncbi:hypothetical protein, partial [Haematobacter missouriensis]
NPWAHRSAYESYFAPQHGFCKSIRRVIEKNAALQKLHGYDNLLINSFYNARAIRRRCGIIAAILIAVLNIVLSLSQLLHENRTVTGATI